MDAQVKKGLKPFATVVVALLLALSPCRVILAGDADKPEVVEVPEQPEAQANAASDKGSSTAEIPSAADEPVIQQQQQQSAPDPASQTADYDGFNSAPPVVPNLRSLREFMDQMNDASPLGLELREERSSLKTGETISGLAVISIEQNSPAARAGLHPYSGATHAVLEGATMAATMVFPPAIVALTIIDQTHVGESYDLIIGVDGTRVCDLLEFEDQTRMLKPGDTVYLNIVRGGTRMQIPVLLPPLTQASTQASK
ncbi:MAG TPA: PDZ domain-containing protein [Candidatus Binataceae bacterium]|nr:PDZ domain-containing protein [Candidatus Binataceae bacterium]